MDVTASHRRNHQLSAGRKTNSVSVSFLSLFASVHRPSFPPFYSHFISVSPSCSRMLFMLSHSMAPSSGGSLHAVALMSWNVLVNFLVSSRTCLASRDPYCIWLRTGSCANTAPGYRY